MNVQQCVIIATLLATIYEDVSTGPEIRSERSSSPDMAEFLTSLTREYNEYRRENPLPPYKSHSREDITTSADKDVPHKKECFLILVTGVTGYIGSHIAKLLMDEGYRVRGATRDTTANEGWLQGLSPNAAFPIEVVQIDLINDDVARWRQVVKDCTHVVHVASPFPDRQPKRVKAELMTPAIEGTKKVLEACAASSSNVRRVVLTSSVAAVHGEIDWGKYTFTEPDWTNVNALNLDDYSKSKTLAEREAWDFVRSNELAWDLVVINPAMAFGPILNRKAAGTSVDIVRRMFNRLDMMCIPRINFSMCDVRDVALAHLRALFIQLEFKREREYRFIIATKNMWLKEVAIILKKDFNLHGHRIATKECSNALVWFKSLFDPSAKLLRRRLGAEIKFGNEKMRNVLGIDPKDAATTIVDMGNSLIEKKMVKPWHRGILG